jgi:hypothetical protein
MAQYGLRRPALAASLGLALSVACLVSSDAAQQAVSSKLTAVDPTAVHLVNVLMVKDVIALAPAWGYLQVAVTTLDEQAFMDAKHAAAGRARLAKDFDG